MNDLDHWDGQYRRPRPHFSDEKADVRPTIDRRSLLTGGAMLAGLALLMALAFMPGTTADDLPDAAQVQSDAQQTTAEGCQIIQHLTYTPCGHDLTRRQALPPELVGKTRTEITAAYGPWQVTTFAAAEITMEQTVSLYCPEHVVLMPDEGGMLCIFQNKYGDALALLRETGVLMADLPDDVQNKLRSGLGFSTIEELEKWLEGADS